VNASEKLDKMIVQALGEIPKGIDPRVYGNLAIELMDALPQIVAVVKAAEHIPEWMEGVLIQECRTLKEALSALDEALL
jgi:hypothetical protein